MPVMRVKRVGSRQLGSDLHPRGLGSLGMSQVTCLANLVGWVQQRTKMFISPIYSYTKIVKKPDFSKVDN